MPIATPEQTPEPARDVIGQESSIEVGRLVGRAAGLGGAGGVAASGLDAGLLLAGREDVERDLDRGARTTQETIASGAGDVAEPVGKVVTKPIDVLGEGAADVGRDVAESAEDAAGGAIPWGRIALYGGLALGGVIVLRTATETAVEGVVG